MTNRSVPVVFMSIVLTSMAQTQTTTKVNDPTKSAYRERDQDAPKELDVFSFLIGTWEGKGKTRLDDGRVLEFNVTSIGRYILGGTAIADELHATTPDGKSYLGINLRHYDRNRQTWVVEYLNVSNSFLRKLVNSRSGSVTLHGRNVTVAGESPEFSYRERYEVEDGDNWVLRIETSTDGGESWNERQEIRFQRARREGSALP